MLKVDSFYDVLLSGMPEGLMVTEIVHGISWTAARLSSGGTGVAMHTQGETVSRRYNSLAGMDAKSAAEAVLSWNMEEASEGMAVINAFYNTQKRVHECGGCKQTGAMGGIDITGKTVGFVGHLIGHSGITKESLAPAKRYFVLEREPKPGDYPDSACEYLLPQCDVVVITGSAAINKTLPRILELSKNARTILTGPTVPQCERLLHLGIDRLYGLAVTDGDGLCRSIIEGPGPINDFGERFLLDCNSER